MAAVGKANALPVIIVGLAVCGLPAYALATLFGAGSVAMIAMMVSLFTFISIIGGSLLSDVKTAAVVAPLIFVAATVARLVSEWNAVAGAARRAVELRAYRRCAWSLLAFNIALTGVAFQMVRSGRAWSYPELVVFGVAAFAFANLAMAIVGIVRAHRNDSLVIAAARSVGLAKSIVGMFFLTTTLLVSFGDDGAFRVMMESAVGAICMSAVVAIAAIMLHRSRSGGPLAGGEN